MTEQKPKRLAKEELQRIIDFCKSVESKGLNPFLVDIEDLIAIIREYFPQWKNPEELSLDAEAINEIASIIKLQSEWIKHRVSSLYRDPFLIEEKLRGLPIDKLSDIFLENWRPIIEFEQITLPILAEAMTYWNGLPPFDERWQNIGFAQTQMGATTREELIAEGILLGETFTSELERLWTELKTRTIIDGKINYWDFIGADSYEETVKRAYMSSFLITYGYANLEVRPLEEEIFIHPFKEPVSRNEIQSVSFPISISFEEWKKWKKSREV